MVIPFEITNCFGSKHHIHKVDLGFIACADPHRPLMIFTRSMLDHTSNIFQMRRSHWFEKTQLITMMDAARSQSICYQNSFRELHY